jgi:arylsulfatase
VYANITARLFLYTTFRDIKNSKRVISTVLGARMDIESPRKKVAASISFFLYIVALSAAVELIAILREPQRWLLVSEAWMGTISIQRLCHVLLGVGPVAWFFFWMLLGMECGSWFLQKRREGVFQLDRLSFIAAWSFAYLAGHFLVFGFSVNHPLFYFLTVRQYLFPPLAMAIALPIQISICLLLLDKETGIPSRRSVLLPWIAASLMSIIVVLGKPPGAPRVVGLAWVLLMPVMTAAIAGGLWKRKVQDLEKIVNNLVGKYLSMLRYPAMLTALVLVIVLASGTRTSLTVKGESVDRPNIILITLDTLRADHMGCYGYRFATTPRLDEFARQSTIFANCISTAPYTAPAVWSLMTSQYRTVHSVGAPDKPKIIGDQSTLARVLRKAGYRTTAFVSNYVLRRERRFHQGFEIYDDTFTTFNPDRHLVERTADKTTEYAMNWLSTVGGQNFFLWVHYQDPHGPYIPPEPYLRRLSLRAARPSTEHLPVTDNDGKNGIPEYQYLKGEHYPPNYLTRYDAEIAYSDDYIGRLLDRIRELGLWEKSIVIFTADHGEAMGEHGYYFCHGHDLTEELIHIPLIIRIPGNKQAANVDELVSIIDVAPTVLSAVGLEQDLAGERIDLMPLILGDAKHLDRQYVVAEDVSNRICFRTRDSKYISGDDGERLYDLARNPAETDNLLERHPELAAQWQRLRDDFRKMHSGKQDGIRYAPFDAESLKSLGYIK